MEKVCPVYLEEAGFLQRRSDFMHSPLLFLKILVVICRIVEQAPDKREQFFCFRRAHAVQCLHDGMFF